MKAKQQQARAMVKRSILFALIWWLLAEGEPDSWSIGLPVVILSSLLSLALAPPTPRSLTGLIRFIPFFVVHSLKGAIDVAWRALHPSLPIAPILVDYRMRLSADEARVFMANAISLLPGTLSAMLEGAQLQVHVLDGRRDFRAELAALERQVATLFRDTLDEEGDGGH